MRPISVAPSKTVNFFWSNKILFLNTLKRGLYLSYDLMMNFFNFRFTFFFLDSVLEFLLGVFFNKLHFSFVSNFWFPGALTNPVILKREVELFLLMRGTTDYKIMHRKFQNTLKFKRLLLFFYNLRFLYKKFPVLSFCALKDVNVYPIVPELRKKRLFSFGLSSHKFYSYSLIGNVSWIFFRLGFNVLNGVNIIYCLENLRNENVFVNKFSFNFFAVQHFSKIFNLIYSRFEVTKDLRFFSRILYLISSLIKSYILFLSSLFEWAFYSSFFFKCDFISKFINFFRFLNEEKIFIFYLLIFKSLKICSA